MKDKDVVHQFVKICKERKIKVSVAESCTGGKIASLITEIPGASQFFDRGLVVYSLNAKRKILGISQKLLDNYGAVSFETAVSMARNVQIERGLSIATTGICNVDEEYEIGVAYIAVCYNKKLLVNKIILSKGRKENILIVAKEAFDLALSFLK